jgi:hypothetical protein
VGKPEGKRPPGRPRRRWEDNIKMDFLILVMLVRCTLSINKTHFTVNETCT